jgi:metal-responsive CopG/Arc/MetJ family transcriptional regulator
MPKIKIAITMSKDLLEEIDRLTSEGECANRSQAIEKAVGIFLARRRKVRLLSECAKLDSAFERKLSEEGLSGDVREWPEY